MSGEKAPSDLRHQLLLAGIDEIAVHGVQSFSMRRVAKLCGVSCAAPYRHFRDKDAFLAAIVAYIGQLWDARQQEILSQTPLDLREQLVESALGYIRFLVERPAFRAILLSTYAGSHHEAVTLGRRSAQLVQDYCRAVHMDEQTQRLKVYIVRSLIYGAALLFGTGELEYNEKNMALAAYTIEREFDLV